MVRTVLCCTMLALGLHHHWPWLLAAANASTSSPDQSTVNDNKMASPVPCPNKKPSCEQPKHQPLPLPKIQDVDDMITLKMNVVFLTDCLGHHGTNKLILFRHCSLSAVGQPLDWMCADRRSPIHDVVFNSVDDERCDFTRDPIQEFES